MIRRRRLSRGQIAVTLIIVMTTLLGAIGLGADLSVLYYNWVILQKAADASALAGASKLTGDTATTSNSAVVSTGTTYAHTNGIGRATDTILVSPAADDKSVSVYLSRQVPYFFLQLVGVKSGKVTAKATAGVQPTNGICGAAPFGLPCKQGCNGNGCYGQGAAAGAGDATCGGAYTFNTSNLSAGTQVQLKSNQSITGFRATGIPWRSVAAALRPTARTSGTAKLRSCTPETRSRPRPETSSAPRPRGSATAACRSLIRRSRPYLLRLTRPSMRRTRISSSCHWLTSPRPERTARPAYPYWISSRST